MQNHLQHGEDTKKAMKKKGNIWEKEERWAEKDGYLSLTQKLRREKIVKLPTVKILPRTSQQRSIAETFSEWRNT